MVKKKIPPPSLSTFDGADQYTRNRLLLEWLSCDSHRAKLYEIVNAKRSGRLEFPSRDTTPRASDGGGVGTPAPPPEVGHKTVVLITERSAIETILRNEDGAYSNRVYAELGGGSFMLALDPRLAIAHREQKNAFASCFPRDLDRLVQLGQVACQAAAITALQAPVFDLASFAAQSALRFCQKLMGYALSDYPVLEGVLDLSYRALVYQVLGRHFVTDPLAIPTAQGQMGNLRARTSLLIDAYAAKDEEALVGCKDRSLPAGLMPVLEALAQYPGDMNGEQRAVIAVGAAIGTIGNVQAAACIAVKALFDDPRLWDKAIELAAPDCTDKPIQCYKDWKELIQHSLRKNPPIPFLPRLQVGKNGAADREVILALGGGTLTSPGGDDPLVWGLPTDGPHWCSGKDLAWPLIVEIVRQTMALPGLAQCLDPRDAKPIGLKKRWGFACESYPLIHRRDSRVAQSSLNVAMRLKPPVRASADAIRTVIRAGAPRIEEALREARQVHFAWFELIEGDSVCVLHTVYDGPFDAYIQDFALKVGDLFDLLFEHIDTPPPRPVKLFPNEFVALIQRFDRAPAMGYFFSAYPRSDVPRIIRDGLATP